MQLGRENEIMLMNAWLGSQSTGKPSISYVVLNLQHDPAFQIGKLREVLRGMVTWPKSGSKYVVEAVIRTQA